jgi:hypothetical protein
MRRSLCAYYTLHSEFIRLRVTRRHLGCLRAGDIHNVTICFATNKVDREEQEQL